MKSTKNIYEINRQLRCEKEYYLNLSVIHFENTTIVNFVFFLINPCQILPSSQQKIYYARL